MLAEGEWLLELPGVALSLGGVLPAGPPRSGIFHREAPDLGEVGLTLDDADRPRMDGVAFGSDYRRGRTITFTLGLRADSEAAVLLHETQLRRAWRGDSVRLTPGATATLTTLAAGRSRAVYGRPRRLTVDHSGRRAGWLTAVADFACIDDVFYGPENSTRIERVPSSSGGFTAPFTSPLTTVTPGTKSGLIVMGGDLDCGWVRAVVYGPITDPEVRITNQWSLKLKGAIPAGQWVTLDPRPWARTVLRSDGASLAGWLTRESRLSKACLGPGSYEAALVGTDATGTAYMDLIWQASYAGLGGDVLIDTETVDAVLPETGSGGGPEV